jgi:hypothetical protein
LPGILARVAARPVGRGASRDLLDLWLLKGIGAFNIDAAELFRGFGPTNKLPPPDLFSRPPDETTWRRELAGQTRLTITAADALDDVRDAWSRAVDLARQVRSRSAACHHRR